MFNIEDYNYDLPPGLIAQVPVAERDCSRLLLVNRATEAFSDHRFFDLPQLLRPLDLLVLNDTRVVPARLFGRKESGGRIEILVLDLHNPGKNDSGTRWCLLKSSKRPKEGARLFLESGVSGRVQELGENGLVRIRFSGEGSVDDLIEEKGRMPLPPYIKRDEGDDLSSLDKERYQTVYAASRGAVAAPTAGLHFTKPLIRALKAAGIDVAYLTLHVGHGTFLPVRTGDIRRHRLSEEDYRIGPQTAAAIARCKGRRGRVVAVGTTVVRALETAFAEDGSTGSAEGKTNLLVTPGFQFKVVDGLITNFHLPKSSLLFLVAAFAGLALTKRAYASAVTKKYRFYSYGDAMLLL
jgi:S-adenosylmethionine:tRNA ribosyltransferase-isomerase